MSGARLFELRTNEEKEKRGVWIDYPDDPNTKFLIASMRSPYYRSAHAKELRRKGLGKRKFDEDAQGQLEAQIASMANAVLLDWKGEVILDEKEGPIPYTHANAVRALKIRQFREDFVMIMAFRDELFEEGGDIAADEAALKNGSSMAPAVPPAAGIS